MIPGTGPGRGVSWWRHVLVLRMRPDIGTHWFETPDLPRPGRLIKVVGKP